MKEITSTIYVTDDGKEFTNKEDAIEHERKLNNIKYFLVRYAPDLNEGRGFQKQGVVMVHAKSSHKEFVEHWCYENLGNRIDFVMGVYGSNAITMAWMYIEIGGLESSNHQILDKIEEQFVDKIWEDEKVNFKGLVTNDTRYIY